MPTSLPHGRLRILGALLLPLAALALQYLMLGKIEPTHWFLLYPAVAFAAWFGGRAAGVGSTVVAVILHWADIQYERGYVPFTYAEIALTVIFVVMGILFSEIFHRMRRKQQLLNDNLVSMNFARLEATHLRSVLNGMSEGVVLQTSDGTIVDANRAAETILALSRDQLVSRTSVDPRWNSIHEDGSAFPGDTHPAMVTLRTGKPIRSQIMGIEVPGHGRPWISINAEPIFTTGSAKPTAVVTTFIDVTERKAADELLESTRILLAIAHEKLERSSEALEREVAERTRELVIALENATSADRAKTAFLATMSHELRTPLNAVIGFSSLLLDGMTGHLSDEQRVHVALIKRGGDQLLGLVTEVLDVMMIESGKLLIHLEPVALQPLLQDLYEASVLQAHAAGLEFSSPSCEGTVVAFSDGARLRQVIENLLSNAIKFTDHGRVELRVSINADFARVEVEDTGIGISPDKLCQLFIPFQRIVETGTKLRSGTGLGLSICRRLVELLGGTIGVESEFGHGSTFWFTVPLAPCTESLQPSQG